MKTVMMLLLFSSVTLAQNNPTLLQAKAACGADNISFDLKTHHDDAPVFQAEAGKALVYVIGEDRGGWCDGCGIIARVGMNGTWVGAINGDSHLSFSVDPGEQHVCVNWQSRFSNRSKRVALAQLNAESGKIYYFRMRLTIQGEHNPALLDLDPIDSDEGKYMVAASKLAVSTAKK